jgi:hypothetical protein
MAANGGVENNGGSGSAAWQWRLINGAHQRRHGNMGASMKISK